MGYKWLKYGMALVAGIPVALCLSVVCCGTSSLPADIWKMTGGGCMAVVYSPWQALHCLYSCSRKE